VANGLRIRAGFIEMDENRGKFEETARFLQSMGVNNTGRDRLRNFGRGSGGEVASLSELCGSCCRPVLSVASNGDVSPCIMSRGWPVGSVLKDSLCNIATRPELTKLRADIFEATAQLQPVNCGPYGNPCVPDGCFPCSPNAQCSPCSPNSTCGPTQCRPYCMPNPG
jgi:MoaA/NifB/PqqE/SkfB family radical SAM enzyme